MRPITCLLPLVVTMGLLLAAPVQAREGAAGQAPAPQPDFDAELARRVGADEHGMRSFVLVILKTGPERMPEGEARKAMFAGHFANMERLAEEGKLALAGPFSEDPDQWRGLFVLATGDIEEARQWVATDPVIVNGEMVAEYHRWYGSAATMLVNDWHARIAKQSP